jgi:tRNA(Ile)-lysidine synthase
LAETYELPYYSQSLALGTDASEDKARQARYAYLRSIADQNNARIVTAHHGDDVVESVAINLHRGTGWRGLATHDGDVARPLLGYTKNQLRDYVRTHGLEWREDSTNVNEKYLRNRLRKHVSGMSPEKKSEILKLREKQRQLKQLIEAEIADLIGTGPTYSRYFLTHVSKRVAIEALRHITQAHLTRPQLHRVWLAIKTAAPGTTYQAGNGVRLSFTTRQFSVSLV